VEEKGIKEERRKYERLKTEFTFHYSIFNSQSLDKLEKVGQVIDIGGGGLRFVSPQRWEKNEQLLMKLDFDEWQLDESVRFNIASNDDSTSVLVIGTVMWCSDTPHEDQFEVGVRFTARIHGDLENNIKRAEL